MRGSLRPIAAACLLSLAPYLALGGGQGLDTVSTWRFLRTGRCVERNAAYGVRPSTSRLVITKTAATVGVGMVGWWLEREGRTSGRKLLRRIGQGLLYGGGAVGAADGARNLAVCGW